MNLEQFRSKLLLIASGRYHRLPSFKELRVDDTRACIFCGLLESEWECDIACPTREDT